MIFFFLSLRKSAQQVGALCCLSFVHFFMSVPSLELWQAKVNSNFSEWNSRVLGVDNMLGMWTSFVVLVFRFELGQMFAFFICQRGRGVGPRLPARSFQMICKTHNRASPRSIFRKEKPVRCPYLCWISRKYETKFSRGTLCKFRSQELGAPTLFIINSRL